MQTKPQYQFKLKKTIKNKLVISLFNFYMRHQKEFAYFDVLKKQESYDAYENKARLFLKEYNAFTVQSFEGVSLLEPHLYLHFKRNWCEPFTKLVFGLDSFRQVVANILLDQKPEIIDYVKPSRSVSPSPEAYIPRPFNKMDVNPSKNSYALLFEPYM